jgi:hypothetical protein
MLDYLKSIYGAGTLPTGGRPAKRVSDSMIRPILT